MPDKKQADDAVRAQLDHDPPETYQDLVAESALGTVKEPAARVRVVMSARRSWSIGQSIGLSRGYTFTPGEAVEVEAADAGILCRQEWDGRRFRRASD